MIATRPIETVLQTHVEENLCKKKKETGHEGEPTQSSPCQLVYLIPDATPSFLLFFFPSPTHYPSSPSGVVSQGIPETARWINLRSGCSLSPLC